MLSQRGGIGCVIYTIDIELKDGMHFIPMSIQFAPLSIPFQRRQQTLAVLLYCSLIPTGIALYLLAWYYSLYPLVILYSLYLITDNSPQTGGKRSHFIRNSVVWHWFANYFPVSLVKVIHSHPQPSLTSLDSRSRSY